MRSLLTCIAIVVLCVCLWCLPTASASATAPVAALEQFLELFGRTIELLAKAKGHGGAFGVRHWRLLAQLQLATAVAIVAPSSLAPVLLALRLALWADEKAG